MERNGGRIRNWIANNIFDIIGFSFNAFTILASRFKGKEIGWGIFCTVINILVVGCILKAYAAFLDIRKQFNMYKAYRRKIEGEVRQYGNTKKYNYAYCKEKSRKKFFRICFIILLKKCMVLLVFVGSIICVCLCNPDNANAYWNHAENIMGITLKEEEIQDEESKETDDTEAVEMEKTIREVRSTEWRFVLDEPTKDLKLENERIEQVFFEADNAFVEWEDYVQDTVNQWKRGKEGVNYITIEDEEGNDFYTYTAMEDRFKERVENASQYLYYDEWQKEAPHSADYDECIKGRETLNKVKAEGETGCHELWWRLANDYQYYAQEYERQTTNAEAILYYYVNSIYCCMEALKYSISEEEYSTIYHFMVMRYHDICRDKCIIPQNYKETADRIYAILVITDIKK